jgi:serine/threonine-protein kinase
MSPDVRSLWSILDEDDQSRERAILKIALMISVATIALSTLGTLIFPNRGGAYAILLAVAATGWFSVRVVFARLDNLTRVIGHVLVTATPAFLIFILHANNGPEAAFSSWIPPQLWLLCISFSVLRLRVWLPVVLAFAAAASYAAVWLLLRPVTDSIFTTAPVLVLRMLTLLLWGGLAAGTACWIRRSFALSARKLRSRDLFGKYRLGPEIAKGGMGSVRRAVYCPEGGFFRDVAVKCIHPHLSDDAATVARFRAEAELGARLHHQNIVATLDFGRAAGTYFLAMEYVDGASLRQLLKGSPGPAPARVAAHIGREVCRGLRFAHELATDQRGRPLRVVHRDLCPNNILVARSGHVKIADFGIAHALGDDENVLFTQKVLGKPAYLAPEQVRAEPHDARVDLFSLGSVLWELVTGERAFQRDNQAATLFAVAHGDRSPLASLRPDLDERWERFFSRALAPDVFERFQSAAEMGDALAELEGRALPPDELHRWAAAALERRPTVEPEPTAETPADVTDEIYTADTLLASNDNQEPTQESGPPSFSAIA